MPSSLVRVTRAAFAALPLLVCIGCVVALVWLLLLADETERLVRIQNWADDWRTAYLSDRLPDTHPKIAIVTITQESLEGYNPYIIPVDRGLVADVVTAVHNAGARAIGLDFYYLRELETEKTERLVTAIRAAKGKVVVGALGDSPFQTEFLQRSQAAGGLIYGAPDSDRVIRNKPAEPNSFFALLAKIAGAEGQARSRRIAWLLPPRNGETFLKIKAQDLLEGRADAALLRDRIVLIGAEFAFFDMHWTPLSIRTRSPMSGTEIHAHMVAELVDGNRSYFELRGNPARLFAGCLAALGIVLGWGFHRRDVDFLDWRVASFGLIAIDAAAFKFAHYVLPWTLAAFAWILGVTLGTQLRKALAWVAARRGDDR